MSRNNTQRYWLLPSVIFCLALCLTASVFRSEPAVSPPYAVYHGAIKHSALASLPPHLGVAASYPRHRYIVQAQSSESARHAVSRAGGA